MTCVQRREFVVAHGEQPHDHKEASASGSGRRAQACRVAHASNRFGCGSAGADAPRIDHVGQRRQLAQQHRQLLEIVHTQGEANFHFTAVGKQAAG